MATTTSTHAAAIHTTFNNNNNKHNKHSNMTFPFRRSSFATFLWLLVSSTTTTSTNAVTQLTVDNFEELTEGRGIFIKFFAPWCGHCRAMADDWEKLASDWAGHPYGLIAEVDCTTDGGQPICEDFDVQGFPTLVYGDPMSAETYDGPREYDDMAEFAKLHISKPICSIFHPSNCQDDELALIQALEAKTTEELEELVALAEAEVQLEETAFDEKVGKIQQEYDNLVEDFNKNLDVIKDKHNYKYVEQLLTIREQMEEDDDEEGGSDEL
mmetsp:Transcript_108574/g.162419  ORF Transcript_108574/g.162419 Transcript_108574/m.162419 type:complete len:269 (+) Transcript_108574:3-809(+)